METIPNHVKQIFLCSKRNTIILGFPELELNFTKSVLYLKWSYFSTLVRFLFPVFFLQIVFRRFTKYKFCNNIRCLIQTENSQIVCLFQISLDPFRCQLDNKVVLVQQDSVQYRTLPEASISSPGYRLLIYLFSSKNQSL